MKKFITLIVIAIFVGLSNVSADTETWTTDNTNSGTVVSTGTTDNSSTWSTEEENEDEADSEDSEDNHDSWTTSTGTTTSTWTTTDNRVKDVQKRFVWEFKDLKSQYKEWMWDKESRNEYLKKKNELFKNYKEQLAETHKEMKEKREEIKANYKEKREDVKQKLEQKRVEIRNKFNETYMKKYGEMISKLDEAKLKTLIEKIDALVLKVNSGSYTDEAKAKLLWMLEALRWLASSRLENIGIESELNSLFQ